eukprot:1099474-Rhodomonas_salina.4
MSYDSPPRRAKDLDVGQTYQSLELVQSIIGSRDLGSRVSKCAYKEKKREIFPNLALLASFAFSLPASRTIPDTSTNTVEPNVPVPTYYYNCITST